jgi:ABC-type ATPase involved in cell division
MATHDENIVNSLQKRVVSFHDKQVFSDKEKGKYSLK